MLKSNIFSTCIFIAGLFISYFISQELTQNEKDKQAQNILLESQMISHHIQHQLQDEADKVLLILTHWHSVEDINKDWEADTARLKEFSALIKEIRLFPLHKIPQLTLSTKYLIGHQETIDKKREHRKRIHLPTHINALTPLRIYSSRVSHVYEYTKTFDLQFPIIMNDQLIAYLEVTIDLSKLLTQKIKASQIPEYFSLSEAGRTIFSSLPETIHINNIEEKFIITVYGREWNLMVWPTIPPTDKKSLIIFSFILSLLLAISCKLFLTLFCMRKKIKEQEQYLKRSQEEFKNNEAKLLQSNKLASLGEIAAGIAHEINQPLQVICIHTELCQENLVEKKLPLVEKSFKAIVSQVERIEQIVKQVSSFGRGSESVHYKKENTKEIFDNVINIIINQYNQDNIELRQVIPPSLPALKCNKIQIEQVLINLLINAKDAVETTKAKIVFIKAHVQEDHLVIQISDTGSGIAPNQLDDLFTPFYTTKALGTGLGLSISYSIIEQHKGQISVSSEVDKGSVFTLTLPLQ